MGLLWAELFDKATFVLVLSKICHEESEPAVRSKFPLGENLKLRMEDLCNDLGLLKGSF